MDVQLLKKDIDKVKVVSFDVFDTLLFRITACPEDIFSLIGKKLGISDFKQIRMKYQQEISRILLKSGKAPHANLDQIYDYIAKNNSAYNWENVKKLEIEMEQDAVICNHEMFEIYQYAVNHGKRIIAVSDMYFNAEQIQMLLENCGYLEISAVYSSADLKKTKYERTIFDEVAKREKVQGEEILHIGDNKKADVECARSCGWISFWYDKNDSKREKRPGMFAGLTGKLKRPSSFWYELGGDIAGTLYVNLYQWLLRLKKKYNCEKICLLARDGYNLWQICKNVDRKDVIYLETSRRALLLAGIQSLDQASLEILPPYALGQTLEEILDYLGVKEACSEYRAAGFESLQDIICTDEDRKKVKKVFQINEKNFLQVCANERKEAEVYFRKKGLFEERVLYFDCGWNGGSQYLLKRFYDAISYEDEMKFAYVGIMDTQKSKRQLKGMDFDTYLFGPGKNQKVAKELLKAIVIPELFFGSPYPSVWYYQNGSVVYEQEEKQQYKELIAEGIADYFEKIYPFICKYAIVLDNKETLKGMERLIKAPTLIEAVKIGDIENVDGFVKQEEQKKYIAKLNMATILRQPRIEIYWQAGLLKRPDISIGVKGYVVLKNLVKSMLKNVRKK